MGNGTNVRILERADHALRDPLARLILSVVYAGHDPIRFGQHGIRQVEPATLEDVHFDAFEHFEPAQFRVELVDLLPLAA